MKISLEQFSETIKTNIEDLSFSQRKYLIDILIKDILVTRVKSQIHLDIQFKFESSRLSERIEGFEPKKSSPEPKNGTEEPSMS